MLNRVTLTAMITLAVGLGVAGQATAEEGKKETLKKQPEITIKAQKLSDNIYVLFGQGGNIGLSVGEDGTYIIDDQFAPLTDKINASIKKITDQPVKFVVNTHWHFDHTGGNENFGKQGAVIVAHDNVHRRMKKGQDMKAIGRNIPAAPKAALPVITFDHEMSLQLNGDLMRAYHVENAHTDGDSIIFFEQDNILHMGDTYFNIGYPFVDLGSGGSIDGYIAALEKGLSLSDEQTQIIPGHGPMATKADMATYVAMLKDIRNKVAQLKASGKTLEEVIKAQPSKEYDAKNGKAFIKPGQIISFIYKSL